MKIIAIILILSLIGINQAYGEEIFVTLMKKFEDITWDGKWTSRFEWKGTSETRVVYEGDLKLVIRTGHDYENLFVFIDVVQDNSMERISDKGIVCIDGKGDGSSKPKNDDFCFIVSAGSNQPTTLQGGHFIAQKGFFKKIPNHPQLLAMGGISDEMDRYSKIPHTSYEFKIPLEIVGKSDNYGFYVGAFDAKTGEIFRWPPTAIKNEYPFIPPPESWGRLISPDKSIPEFEFPFLVMASTFLIIFIPRIFGWLYSKNKNQFTW